MTVVKDYTAIRHTAFGRLKTWTQAIDKLPSDDVLFKRALIVVRAVTYGQALEHKVIRSLASDIARYIRKNFDPAKRRPAPKSNRAQRTARNKAILTAALAAGASKSTRQLALEFGLTASQISRILQQAGNQRRRRSPPSINNDLVFALQLLAEIQPKDGQCVVREDFLLDNLAMCLPEASTSSILDLIDEIEQAKRGWSFTFGGDLVVISKGRRLTQEVAASLASRRSVREDQPNRILQSFGRKVWADLFAALSVIQERARPGDWRAFLAATLISSTDIELIDAFPSSAIEKDELVPIRTLVCDDTEALVTRIGKALRLRKDRDFLDAIRAWNREYSLYASAMSGVLDIVELTQDTGWPNALQIWMRLSCYGDRIRLGLLNGRDIADIDVFMHALQETDGDAAEMIDILRSAAMG